MEFIYQKAKMLELGISVEENSSEEIYKSFKHFHNLINSENYKPTVEQD